MDAEWRMSEEQYHYLLNEIDYLRDRISALESEKE